MPEHAGSRRPRSPEERRSDVTLVTGAASRDEVIEIAGPPAALTGQLDELFGQPARAAVHGQR